MGASYAMFGTCPNQNCEQKILHGGIYHNCELWIIIAVTVEPVRSVLNMYISNPYTKANKAGWGTIPCCQQSEKGCFELCISNLVLGFRV